MGPGCEMAPCHRVLGLNQRNTQKNIKKSSSYDLAGPDFTMMAKCLLNSKLWRLTVVPKGFFSVTPQTLNLITYGRLNSHTLTEGETSLEEMEIKAMQIIRNFTEEDRKHLKRLEDEYWHVRTEGNRAVSICMNIS